MLSSCDLDERRLGRSNRVVAHEWGPGVSDKSELAAKCGVHRMRSAHVLRFASRKHEDGLHRLREVIDPSAEVEDELIVYKCGYTIISRASVSLLLY